MTLRPRQTGDDWRKMIKTTGSPRTRAEQEVQNACPGHRDVDGPRGEGVGDPRPNPGPEITTCQDWKATPGPAVCLL